MRLAKVILSLITSLALSTAACAAEKLVVAYLPNLHGLPLYTAIEEKLFETAGISVELVRFENPNQIIDALVSGRADTAPAGGAAGISALAETRFPNAMKVFGLQGSNDKIGAVNDTLIVKRGSTIRKFGDLKGKKLAHLPGIQWKTIARAIAKANGIDPDSGIELVEIAIGLQVQAVASGTVDAALAVEPVGAIASSSEQVEVVADNLPGKYIADPFFAGAGLLTTTLIKERPEVAKKLIEVMDKAVSMIQSDFGTYRKYLVGYTAITDRTVGTVKPMFYLSSKELSEESVGKFQKFADIFFADGVTKKKLDVSKMMLGSE